MLGVISTPFSGWVLPASQAPVSPDRMWKFLVPESMPSCPA